MKTNVVKLQFVRNGEPSGRAYTYYSNTDVAVGDLVEIEAGKQGVITQIDVPVEEIAPFADRAKTILGKGENAKPEPEKPQTEKKIYSSYAFTENEREKMAVNYNFFYKQLKEKATVIYRTEQATDELLKAKSVLLDYKHGCAHTDYKILSNPHNLTMLELALVCDGGSLCFGYRGSGDIITILTD